MKGWWTTGWLWAAALAGQGAPSAIDVEARLTAPAPVVVSGTAAELILEIRVTADSSLDAAVFDGVHLQAKVEGAVAGTVGAAADRRVAVAAGTTIRRSLAVTLPVETASELKRVSVSWPGLPGASASIELAPPQTTIDVDALDLARTRVLLVTSHGTMSLTFLPDKAPAHVRNFVELSKSGFYDGTTFHLILKDYIVQGGCPNTKAGAEGVVGSGRRPGPPLKAELSDVRHQRGVLSMARGPDLDSASCQFLLCHGDAAALDGKYTAFGQLESGFDTLDKIAAVPVRREGQSVVPLQRVSLHKAIVLPVFE